MCLLPKYIFLFFKYIDADGIVLFFCCCFFSGDSVNTSILYRQSIRDQSQSQLQSLKRVQISWKLVHHVDNFFALSQSVGKL
jgi:predicted Zn-dependent protease with MMP-like domain